MYVKKKKKKKSITTYRVIRLSILLCLLVTVNLLSSTKLASILLPAAIKNKRATGKNSSCFQRFISFYVSISEQQNRSGQCLEINGEHKDLDRHLETNLTNGCLSVINLKTQVILDKLNTLTHLSSSLTYSSTQST